MNPITNHRNPWTPGSHWQVFGVDPGHTIDAFPLTAAVCSHHSRNTATACAWLRDLAAVAATRYSPRLAYSIRRTPNSTHRTDEENGIPCATPDNHYCVRLGIWTSHHDTAPGDSR